MSLSRYFHPKELASDERSNDSNGLSSNCNKETIATWMHSDTNKIQHELDDDIDATSLMIKINSPANQSDLVIDSDTNPPSERLFESVNDTTGNGENFDETCENTKAQPQIDCPVPVAVNRFAKWAYHSQENDSSRKNQHNTSTKAEISIKGQSFVDALVSSKKRQRPRPEAKATPSTGLQCKKAFVPMKDLSQMEQQSEIEKWHSITTLFTPPDIDVLPYTIEDRRYHMLLATLLHTRCQEPSVRVAIIQLVNYFQLHDVPITVLSMAGNSNNIKVNISSDIVPLIKNLQYYNSKVKYIMQSSQYICDHFNGIVPTTEKELLRLPGIGPLFADLLATINTIPLHEQYLRTTTTG